MAERATEIASSGEKSGGYVTREVFGGKLL
jgi:hypothetical protein